MQMTIENVRAMLKTINLYTVAEKIEEILNESLKESMSYEKFLENFLQCEIKGRQEKRFERNIKQASFPEYKTLDEFDLTEQQSLSKRQFNQLKELSWIEQGYNLILLGPTGVGKTMCARSSSRVNTTLFK
ncbi:UNVERIFIED_CONTAM: DNA replication protein [Acetivibrio alkalicellulosi]